MTWPSNPSGGTQVIINGIMYQYDAVNLVWNRLFSTINVGAGMTSTATVTANAQPNITSVGTLSSLNIFGNLTTGNANLGNLVTANWYVGTGVNITGNISSGGNVIGIHYGNGYNLSGLFGSNVLGQVGNSLVAGTVYTAAQPSITSVGTLTSLNVTGNVSSGGNVIGTHFGNGYNLSGLFGSNVLGQVGNSLVAGTVYTSAQPSITSVGTLTSLNVTGNISSGNANLGNLATSTYFNGTFINGTNLTINTFSTFGLSSDRTTFTASTSGGTVNLDVSASGPVWYYGSVSSAFTANLQNVPSTTGFTTVVALIFVNSTIVPSVNINGSAQTIKWVNGSVPVGSVSATNIYTFTLMNVNNGWLTFGQLAQYV